MDNEQKIPDSQFEEIERFLQGTMLPEERDAFSGRLATDMPLKRLTDEYRLLFLGVQEASLEEKLNDFHRASSGKVLPIGRWLLAAAVLTVIAISAWWLFFKAGKEESLFADYFQPDPGLISAMSSSSDNYSFDRAMIDYKTGNYQAAIKTWDSLLITRPGNDTLNYFLGSAWLAKKQTAKAIPYFQKVIALPDSYFKQEAEWYLGLAFLKDGNTTQAIPLLEQSEHPLKEALLIKLKK